MDKAEAIKILKDFHDESALFSVRTALETLHPELKESEDEKVKQKIINLIKKSNEVGGYALHKWEADEMLAWLEKQRKPRMQHGITINGVEYELIVDHEADECERCALKGECNNIGDDTLCNAIFGSDIVAHRRFEKKTKEL